MPRLTVGNQEIVVVFKHGVAAQNPNYPGKRPKPTDYTNCVVLVGELGTRDESKTLIGDATLYRNTKDTPNRVIARRNAFQEVASGALTVEQINAVLNILREVKLKPILPKPVYPPATILVEV